MYPDVLNDQDRSLLYLIELGVLSQQQRASGILAGVVGVAWKRKPTAQHDSGYSNTYASDPSYIGTFSVRLVVYVGIETCFLPSQYLFLDTFCSLLHTDYH
jgi:hypothetical protein